MGYAIGFCLALILLALWSARHEIIAYLADKCAKHEPTEPESSAPIQQRKPPSRIFTSEQAQDALPSIDANREMLSHEVWRYKRSNEYLLEPQHDDEESF